MGIFGGTGAALSGLFGGQRGPSNIEARNRGARVLFGGSKDLGQQYYEDQGGLLGIRQRYMQELLANARGGFQEARTAAQGGARMARNTVRREGQRTGADVQQYLQNTGLGASNVAAQAMSGVGYQTAQALANIDQELAQMMGDLKVQETGLMDQVLARNLGIEEQQGMNAMAFLAGNAGYGPGGSSMVFGMPTERMGPRGWESALFSIGQGLDNALPALFAGLG
jgi:hypothetical protein